MSVVTRFVDCANHHDAEGLTACVHREFQSVQPFHPGRNFRGSGQLRSNWQAIFDSEPGFRLTVLRSAIAGDTVWVELHGAGEEAEVSGVFIVGVEGGRIRWIRVYSELVDEVAAEEGAEDEQAVAPGAGPVVGVPTGTDDDDEHPDVSAADETSPAPLRLVRDDIETPADATHAADETASLAPADEGPPDEEPADEEPAVALTAADRVAADAREGGASSTRQELRPDDAESAQPKWKSALRNMFGRTEE